MTQYLVVMFDETDDVDGLDLDDAETAEGQQNILNALLGANGGDEKSYVSFSFAVTPECAFSFSGTIEDYNALETDLADFVRVVAEENRKTLSHRTAVAQEAIENGFPVEKIMGLVSDDAGPVPEDDSMVV